jgi:hypothetical protein
MKCKVCGKELAWCGFERTLTTRGKNKGMYLLKSFYRKCDCKGARA